MTEGFLMESGCLPGGGIACRRSVSTQLLSPINRHVTAYRPLPRAV